MIDVRLLVREIAEAATTGRGLSPADLGEVLERAGMVEVVSYPLKLTPELEEYLRQNSWHRGSVRFYLEEKEFGFVVPDDGGEDVFVHRKRIFNLPVAELQKGTRVRYRSEPSKRGPRVTELKVIHTEKAFL